MISINDTEFMNLVTYIKTNYGINLIKKRTLIEGRLTNIIIEKGFDNFSDYLKLVYSDKSGKEMTTLINKLTTNHTFFMRESQHFDYLKETILPYLKETVKDNDIRLWCAGCSTGQEPYTLEMILRDYFGDQPRNWDTTILATDISNRALELASKGIYTENDIEDIPKLWKINYFNKLIGTDKLQIKPEIRNNIVFRSFNLMEKSFPFTKKFNVIFCRNVMIYFDQKTKEELVQKFYDATEPGGYLFIGLSESINRETMKYKYIMPAVYRKI